MNSLYILVEGSETEPALYNAWLPMLLPGSKRLAVPEEAQSNYGFYIVPGYGYPTVLTRIKAAVADILAFPGFGQLIIVLDSEERAVDEVSAEIKSLIERHECPIRSAVIVAKCCIESWLLGNHKFVKRNPSTPDLCSFRSEYDVTEFDPELMPNGRESSYNTNAQYHEAYLKAAYREHGLKFTKSRPGPALERYYLTALMERAAQKEIPKHLQTFAGMLEIFAKA